jgi:hypothetical protein
MLRRFLRWLTRPAPGGPRQRRTRLTGCLFWILALALVLLVLSLLFGGFTKGTKTGGAGEPRRHGYSAAAAWHG